MSKRLEGLARKVRRKKARGLEITANPVVSRPPVIDDPWRDIPETQRRTVTEVRGNMVICSYVDSVEELFKRARPAPPPKPIVPPSPPKPGPIRAEVADEMRRGLAAAWARLDDADQQGRDGPLSA